MSLHTFRSLVDARLREEFQDRRKEIEREIIATLPTVAGLTLGTGKPALFLDFDGVLNNEGLCDNSRPHEHPLFNPLTHLDHIMVTRVWQCVEKWDLEVIVTSDWRNTYNLPSLRAFVEARGFRDTDRIVGATPFLGKYVSRHTEIMAYLTDRGPARPCWFAILDDNPQASNEDLAPFFVQTNPFNGFCEVAKGNLDAIFTRYMFQKEDGTNK